jgi:hypothetical protein
MREKKFARKFLRAPEFCVTDLILILETYYTVGSYCVYDNVYYYSVDTILV